MLHVAIHPKRFAERFKAIAALAPRHHPSPILASIQFSVGADGTGMLAATDLRSAGRVVVPLVRVFEPGTVLLPREKVLKVLGEAGKSSLEIEELAPETPPIAGRPHTPSRRIALATARGHLSFLAHRPEDFPVFGEPVAAEPVEVLAWRLARLIEQTAYATDPDSTRFALGGCMLEFADGRLSMIATDGRALAHAHAPATGSAFTPAPHAEGHPEQPLAPVVDARGLKALAALLAAREQPNREVRLAWTRDGRLQAVADGLFFCSRQLAGRFPSWRGIIPPPSPHRTEVTDAARLKRAVKEARSLLPAGQRAVRLRLHRNLLAVEVDHEEASICAELVTLRPDAARGRGGLGRLRPGRAARLALGHQVLRDGVSRGAGRSRGLPRRRRRLLPHAHRPGRAREPGRSPRCIPRRANTRGRRRRGQVGLSTAPQDGRSRPRPGGGSIALADQGNAPTRPADGHLGPSWPS